MLQNWLQKQKSICKKKVNCERSQILLRKNDFPESVQKKNPLIVGKFRKFEWNLQKGLELWKTVLFPDASKYNAFGSDDCIMCVELRKNNCLAVIHGVIV